MTSIPILLALFAGSPSALAANESPAPFLVYGDGSTMIEDTGTLPKPVRTRIQSIIRAKKPVESNFSAFLPQILARFGGPKRKMLSKTQSSKPFEYSSAKFWNHVDSSRKGDCHNYPDQYLELFSQDTKLSGGNYVLVVPTETRVFPKADAFPKAVAKGLAHSELLPPDKLDDDAWYLALGRKYYVVRPEADMGFSATLIECTVKGKCRKRKSELNHPPCGT